VQQGVRTRTQKRKNLARKGVEILQRVGVSRDYGVQLLDTMKQEGINIQPGIVLENPVFNPGQTLLFGQYGKYFKEVISGKRLVTDKMVPLDLNDVKGEKLTISGKPILNPHLTASDTFLLFAHIKTARMKRIIQKWDQHSLL